MLVFKGQIEYVSIQRGGNPDFLKVPFIAKVGFIKRELEQLSFPIGDAEKIFGNQFGTEYERLQDKKIAVIFHI